MENTPIEVVIADDHILLREGLHNFLMRNGIKVVGEAGDGKQLLNLVAAQTPHLVITDIVMPVMDGIAATAEIIKNFPEIKVLGYSMLEDQTAIIDILEAGALGYLAKNASKEQILEAIHTVKEGLPYYCEFHGSELLPEKIYKSRFNPYKQNTLPSVSFTDRETEIIKLLCKGFSSHQMAQVLNISTRTVEGHRSNIHSKLRVSNPIGIVVYALRKRIVSLEELS